MAGLSNFAHRHDLEFGWVARSLAEQSGAAMIRVTQKEIEAVIRLDGEARFRRFIKVVVDWEEAWGLWDEEKGWAMSKDSAGSRFLPLLPAREYAEICRGSEWAAYQPKAVSLTELRTELLPSLRSQGIRAGIFPAPGDPPVTPDLDAVEEAIREELRWY